MAWQDKKGHFTNEENDGKECLHDIKSLENKYNSDIPKEQINTKKENKSIIHIDFNKDNVLPELNSKDLIKLGVKKNKKVLLKKQIIDINENKHTDVEKSDIPWLIGETLYNSDDIIKGKNKTNNYYSFIKLMEKKDKKGNKMFGVVLLDINETNDYFEIVHWHWVRQRSKKSI